MKKFIFLISSLTLSGCVHRTVITPFHPDAKVAAPVAPESVAIYRSTNPISKFVEIGMINFTDHQLDLPAAFDVLRKESAEQGAEAIIDVKLVSEERYEDKIERKCQTKTTCNTDGTNCSSKEECVDDHVNELVQTYTYVGSMIRRKP